VITAASGANAAALLVADNVLAFPFATVTAGTYTVQAQTLSNASANAVSLTSQNLDNAAANLAVIAVNLGSNTTFTVV
jgi:hypothetical protein